MVTNINRKESKVVQNMKMMVGKDSDLIEILNASELDYSRKNIRIYMTREEIDGMLNNKIVIKEKLNKLPQKYLKEIDKMYISNYSMYTEVAVLLYLSCLDLSEKFVNPFKVIFDVMKYKKIENHELLKSLITNYEITGVYEDDFYEDMNDETEHIQETVPNSVFTNAEVIVFEEEKIETSFSEQNYQEQIQEETGGMDLLVNGSELAGKEIFLNNIMSILYKYSLIKEYEEAIDFLDVRNNDFLSYSVALDLLEKHILSKKLTPITSNRNSEDIKESQVYSTSNVTELFEGKEIDCGVDFVNDFIKIPTSIEDISIKTGKEYTFKTSKPELKAMLENNLILVLEFISVYLPFIIPLAIKTMKGFIKKGESDGR